MLGYSTMKKKAYLSSFKISDSLNISYSRLRSWIKKGYIEPFCKADGAGTRSSFSIYDAYLIKMFEFLITRGFPGEIASYYLRQFDSIMRKEYGEKYQTWVNIIRFIEFVHYKGNPVTVHLYTGSEEEPEVYLNKDFDDRYIINFKKILKNVDKALLPVEHSLSKEISVFLTPLDKAFKKRGKDSN